MNCELYKLLTQMNEISGIFPTLNAPKAFSVYFVDNEENFLNIREASNVYQKHILHVNFINFVPTRY